MDLMRLVDKMPAFPASVQRVVELTSDIQCNPKELVNALDHDPVLTAKILKVANSAYFGVATQIASIKHAVVYLGLNSVKHIAVTVASVGVMPRNNAAGLDMNAFLGHSLATAVIARQLARRGGVSPARIQEHFVAGLLHDIGQVVWAHFRPELYIDVLKVIEETGCATADAEQEILGSTHGELGGLLAEKWQFSQPLIDAIRFHHHAPDTTPADVMRDTVYLASLLAHAHAQTIPEVVLNARQQERFHHPSDSLLERMPDLDQEIQEAWAFMDL